MQANTGNKWSGNANERRALPRYRFYAHLEMNLESKLRWGRVCSISGGGMFIETSECPAKNTRFRGRLALETPLPLECVVRRVLPGRGIGVSVSIANDAEKRRYDALLLALGTEAKSVAEETNTLPDPSLCSPFADA